jgi:hypothetical protein
VQDDRSAAAGPARAHVGARAGIAVVAAGAVRLGRGQDAAGDRILDGVVGVGETRPVGALAVADASFGVLVHSSVSGSQVSVVQVNPSLQMLALMQPKLQSQKSSVHGLVSSQTTGSTTHTPASQRSFMVQKLVSAQSALLEHGGGREIDGELRPLHQLRRVDVLERDVVHHVVGAGLVLILHHPAVIGGAEVHRRLTSPVTVKALKPVPVPTSAVAVGLALKAGALFHLTPLCSHGGGDAVEAVGQRPGCSRCCPRRARRLRN